MASVSQLIILKPFSNEVSLSEDDYNYFKITLFNATRTDSLILPRHNNCLTLKGKLLDYNGAFVLFDKKIKYTAAKVEHPLFLTSVYPINKTIIQSDSIDFFNKKHHIHIYKTDIELIRECPDKKVFDFFYFSDEKPKGGYNYENLIGVLFKDSLPKDSLKEIGNNFGLKFKSSSFTGKQVIYALAKGKLKKVNNKTIIALLNDSTRIKDAGVLIDSTDFQFFSSFFKIHALELNQIEKWKMEPVSGLKSFSKTMAYIKTNELEMGCGLYKNATGVGLKIIDWQVSTFKKELEDKCTEQYKLNENDREYVTLHTRTFSISGGKDIGEKKVQNEKRMGEIHEEDKILKKDYNAPIGYIEPIIISTN